MPILRYLLLTSTLVFVALATADAQISRIGIEVGPDLTQFRERFQGLTVTSDPRATLFVAAPIDFAIADKPLFVRLRPAFTSRASKYEEDGYEVFVGPNDIREVDIRAASGFRTAELGLSVGGELQRAGWTFGATTGLVPAYFLSQFAKVKGLEDYPEEEELFGLDSDGEDWEGIRRFELSYQIGLEAGRAFGAHRLRVGLRHRASLNSLAKDVEDDPALGGLFDDLKVFSRSWVPSVTYVFAVGGSE